MYLLIRLTKANFLMEFIKVDEDGLEISVKL